MVSTYRRNILVGATVLGSLGILAWLSMEFGAKAITLFTPPEVPVEFSADRADGLYEGTEVFYLGVQVGRVTRVALAPKGGVVIDAMIEQTKPALPANIQGFIRTASLLSSGSAMYLEIPPNPAATPLASNAQLSASYVGTDLIPRSLTDTATEIGRLSETLRKSHVAEDLDTTVRTMNEQLKKAGDVLDSMKTILASEKTQMDLQTSLDNIRETSENAKKLTANLEAFSANQLPKIAEDATQTLDSAKATIGKTDARLDELTRQIDDRMAQASTLMNSFNSIAAKMDQGKGTAGMLVNDPQLYGGLVQTTRQLNATIADLQRLVEQWEQEGVSLQLK
jgi:phospholipid/cholesterol/gamma-HCH transport system substrate-binding protein